jgi:hypothetical protein
MLTFFLFYTDNSESIEGELITLSLPVIAGSLSAAGQYLLLRRYLTSPIVWVSASAGTAGIGGIVGFITGTLLANNLDLLEDKLGIQIKLGHSFLFWLCYWGVIGAWVGYGQGWMLRRRLASGGWWVMLTVIIWVTLAWAVAISECASWWSYKCY